MSEAFEWIARAGALAEGPRIDDRGDLYFGDVLGRGLYRCAAGGAAQAVLPDRRSVGGVVIDEAGGVLCSGREGLARFDPVTGETRAVPILIDGVAITSVNDIEADPAGNLYGGTLDYEAFDEGRAPRPSILFRLGRDGAAVKLATLPIPNGMDFSADGARFYLSESGEGVFSYAQGRDGQLADRRLVAAMPDSDGIVLDSAGGLWVARYLCNLLEYHAPGGGLARRIALPFGSVASVTFGGDDLHMLHVAGGDLQRGDQGGVLRLRVDAPGLPPRKAALFA
jgi:sugar lactone lactonase YvrE